MHNSFDNHSSAAPYSPSKIQIDSANYDLKHRARFTYFYGSNEDSNILIMEDQELVLGHRVFMTCGMTAYQLDLENFLDLNRLSFDKQIAGTRLNIARSENDIIIRDKSKDKDQIIAWYQQKPDSSNGIESSQLEYELLPPKVRAIGYHTDYGFFCFIAERVGAYPVSLNQESELEEKAIKFGSVIVRCFIGYPSAWQEIQVFSHIQTGRGVNDYLFNTEKGNFTFPSNNSIGEALYVPTNGSSIEIKDFDPKFLFENQESKTNNPALSLLAREAILDLGLGPSTSNHLK